MCVCVRGGEFKSFGRTIKTNKKPEGMSNLISWGKVLQQLKIQQLNLNFGYRYVLDEV